MSVNASNVERLFMAALDAIRSHPDNADAADVASACMTLAAQAATAVLALSSPGSLEHNRAALLEGAAAVQQRIAAWPAEGGKGAWN